MAPRLSRHDGGFTLLEVVIALGLLAVTLLGVFQMQLYAIRSNTTSRGATTAVHIAEDQVEWVLAQPWNSPLIQDVVPGNGLNSINNPDFQQVVTDAKGNTYTRITNIEDNSPMPGVRSARVIVTWGGNQVAFTTCMRQ